MSHPSAEPGAREAALEALLDFYVEAGVDLAIDETPHNRFAEPDRPQPAASPAGTPAVSPVQRQPAQASSAAAPAFDATASADETALAARATARAATSLEELREALAAFDGCALKATAKNLVFADGTPGARVMLVGEAPGREEDIQGKPFVGRSGQLLDRMLAAIGLDRRNVFISNVVYWRPPGNRTPSQEEIMACLPFARRLIELSRPTVVLALGNAAVQTLLKRSEGITRLRGRWVDYPLENRTVPLMPSFHPAFLLRQPGLKRESWRDFLAVRARLAEAGAWPPPTT